MEPSWRADFLLPAMAAVMLASLPLGAAASEDPTDRHIRKETLARTIGKAIRVDYLLILPGDYGNSARQPWPLIVFLHGAGERGSDLARVRSQGLPSRIVPGGDFPFVVLAPQVSDGQDWDIDVLDTLLDEILARYAVDRERVYLTGLSMGGHATWRWATQRPDRFAAIAPIAASGQRYRACRLSQLPAWVFHGAKDPIVPLSESDSMVKAVNACGGNARLTIHPEAGHDSWTNAYSNPALFDWFLMHRRRAREGDATAEKRLE